MGEFSVGIDDEKIVIVDYSFTDPVTTLITRSVW